MPMCSKCGCDVAWKTECSDPDRCSAYIDQELGILAALDKGVMNRVVVIISAVAFIGLVIGMLGARW